MLSKNNFGAKFRSYIVMAEAARVFRIINEAGKLLRIAIKTIETVGCDPKDVWRKGIFANSPNRIAIDAMQVLGIMNKAGELLALMLESHEAAAIGSDPEYAGAIFVE
jgi:hypothetical protein